MKREPYFVNRMVKKIDLYHLMILIIIAFGIGFYLIATTVLISKDGGLGLDLAKDASTRAALVTAFCMWKYPTLRTLFTVSGLTAPSV